MQLPACGEASIQSQSVLTLPLRCSIHREVHTCFLPPPSTVSGKAWKKHLSPFSSGNSKLFSLFKRFFSWWFTFWEKWIVVFTQLIPYIKTWYSLVMRGLGWGREGCMSWTCEDPPLSSSASLSLGMVLSAHTSTLQHRCCCIVWSSKARISSTGSFYSLAIVSVCLTRPLMNAAVSRRSDTRQRTEKEPTIHL